MEKWEYIVAVQPDGLEPPPEAHTKTMEIIRYYTPTKTWLDEKGLEGWELVTALNRDNYIEFFMKRRRQSKEDEI